MQSRNIQSFTAQPFYWYDNGIDGNRDDDDDLIKLILAANPLYSLVVGFDDDKNDDNDSLDGNRDDDNDLIKLILAADPLYSLGVGFDDDNNDDNDSLDDDGEMMLMFIYY